MSNLILEVQNLTKSFGGLKAVDEVSFKLTSENVVGLIGPNGAGKTTLFSLINGFLRPDKGQVSLQGEDITGLPPYRVCRQGLARTFQVVKPFSDVSVLENIVTASLLRKTRRKEALADAKKVAERLELGDQLHKRAGDLPLASIQRLSIAQALATKPRLLLLDEALAGLNSSEIEGTLSIIDQVAREGPTVFMVEHIMEAIMTLSERILVMNEGKLIADGTPEEVSENDEVIEAYLGE